MIFKWLKGQKRERNRNEIHRAISPLIEPVAQLGAYAELGAEYWEQIHTGKKPHPITAQKNSSVVGIWNDALIEAMGYLVKYSAPNPMVFVEPQHQVATINAILRRYHTGDYRKKELTEPAAGVWPVYDWLRQTAVEVAEVTFGGLDEENVYEDLVRGLIAVLPKWAAGPSGMNILPKTALEVIADDVEKKTKLLALTIQFGPYYEGMQRSIAEKLPEGSPGRLEFDEAFATILAAKNPDDYAERRQRHG